VLHNFKQHINHYFSFLKTSKILVTISGGIDSVVLSHLLHQLKFDFEIAHCNFKLRKKASDDDAAFVKSLADDFNKKSYIKDFDTANYAKSHKLSIQESARNLRYEWFYDLSEKNNIDYIITAHNLNDNLETFIINLSRGTGLKGLSGISSINQKVVRPLLVFTRQQILDFANDNHISWREDLSNADTKYTRNKIRHQIIPILQELNPTMLPSFQKTLEHLQGSEAIINSYMNQIKADVIPIEKNGSNLIKYDIKKLKKLSNLNIILFELFNEYGFTNFNDINTLIDSQSGKQLFSKTHRLVKDRAFLLLKKNEDSSHKNSHYLLTETDDFLKTQDLNLDIKHLISKKNHKPNSEKSIAEFDKSFLKFPLTVRKWEKGDYFYPIGMQGKKKLSKFFKDEKYSLLEKENIWLLLSDQQIIWIIGKRQDDRFKMTNTTTKILKIELK
jgi:tRNA(Ile)-lysidine synthase